MRTYNFFRCPFFERCTKRAVDYIDDGTEFYLPGIECMAAFLEDEKGEPVCMLSIPENELHRYPEKFGKIRRTKE